jgi:hypothetical protein
MNFGVEFKVIIQFNVVSQKSVIRPVSHRQTKMKAKRLTPSFHYQVLASAHPRILQLIIKTDTQIDGGEKRKYRL